MTATTTDIAPHRLIEEYLSKRLGAPVAISRIKRCFPGLSRETYMVFAWVGGAEQNFTLRVDPPWGAATPCTIEEEFGIYSKLWRAGIPVPEPLWWDRDIDFAEGRPHMVRRLVEGSSTIPGLTDAGATGDDLRRRVAYELIENLAALHSLDWKSLGFDELLAAPASAAEALTFDIDLWERRWQRTRLAQSPVVTEFLCWLREQVPTDVPRISLTKGNSGVGEEVFRDGKLVAMCDFELAALTDGALDFGLTQGTLSLLPPGEALAHYGRVFGHPVSPERLAFSTVWAYFKSIVCLEGYTLRQVRDGADVRATCTALGVVHVRQSERALANCIGKDIVAAAAGGATVGGGNYTELD